MLSEVKTGGIIIVTCQSVLIFNVELEEKLTALQEPDSIEQLGEELASFNTPKFSSVSPLLVNGHVDDFRSLHLFELLVKKSQPKSASIPLRIRLRF